VEKNDYFKKIIQLNSEGHSAKDIAAILKSEKIKNHRGGDITDKAITCILYRQKNKKSGPKPELKAIKEIPENKAHKKAKYAVIITDREGLKDILGGLL
jgi:hypothetical protein